MLLTLISFLRVTVWIQPSTDLINGTRSITSNTFLAEIRALIIYGIIGKIYPRMSTDIIEAYDTATISPIV